MESFDEVHDALRDVINNPPESTTADDGKKPAQDPRVAGWAEPIPFSYDNYQNKEFTDWAGMGARYEWNDEYGDVGPRNEELEKQLFNLEFMSRAGVRFDEYDYPSFAIYILRYMEPNLVPISRLKKPGEDEPYSVKVESDLSLRPIESVSP